MPAEPEVFKRYAGCDTADASLLMPTDELDANLSNSTISELIGRLEQFTSNEQGAQMYPWATRFAMGYPLPSWQRELVWTDAQKIRFIESIWAGVDVGSYLVNESWELCGEGHKTTFREFSEILLDGQQRLTALEAYVCNEFAVPDANGTPRFWRELPQRERRRFGSYHFAKATIASWDERSLRRAYDLRAFGGTPHKDSEKATTL